MRTINGFSEKLFPITLSFFFSLPFFHLGFISGNETASMFVVFHKLYSYLPVFLSKNNILVEPPSIGTVRTFDCAAANFLESGLYTVEFTWINLKMDKVYSCTGKRYMGYIGYKTGIR